MKFIIHYKGGSGSGNFRHAGRPGKVGGSAMIGSTGKFVAQSNNIQKATAEIGKHLYGRTSSGFVMESKKPPVTKSTLVDLYNYYIEIGMYEDETKGMSVDRLKKFDLHDEWDMFFYEKDGKFGTLGRSWSESMTIDKLSKAHNDGMKIYSYNASIDEITEYDIGDLSKLDIPIQ